MLDQQLRDVAGPSSGQHHMGQGLVHRRGPFHRGDLVFDRAIGVREPPQRDTALLVEPRVVEGDRGMTGESAEERHLVRLEGTLGSVGGEQDTDRFLTHQERYTQQRHESLAGHEQIEPGVVAEDLGLVVVADPEGGSGLDHAPAQACPGRHPGRRELRRDRARRRSQCEIPVLVQKRQVSEVAADQLMGVSDDRTQNLTDLAERCQRTSRGVQAAEFAFAPQPVRGQFPFADGIGRTRTGLSHQCSRAGLRW